VLRRLHLIKSILLLSNTEKGITMTNGLDSANPFVRDKALDTIAKDFFAMEHPPGSKRSHALRYDFTST